MHDVAKIYEGPRQVARAIVARVTRIDKSVDRYIRVLGMPVKARDLAIIELDKLIEDLENARSSLKFLTANDDITDIQIS